MPDKRVIVCGGRAYKNKDAVAEAIHGLGWAFEDIIIIQGGASGADAIALDFAKKNGIRHETHKADWVPLGRAAGPIRNSKMAARGASICLAFPGGSGTADMIRKAKAHGIQVIEPRDF